MLHEKLSEEAVAGSKYTETEALLAANAQMF
jgi:hypothetical protein